MFGRFANPGDKYVEPPPGPIDWDIESGYRTIDDLLRKNGVPVVDEKINMFPFIQQAIITPSAAVSCYLFDGYLVGNGFIPNCSFEGGIEQGIIVANFKENEDNVLRLMNFLKRKANFSWFRYWKDKKDRIIEVPDKLSNMNESFPYIPNLLNK